MAKRVGRSAKRKSGTAGVQRPGPPQDKRHKTSIVRSITKALLESARKANADEKAVAKRATEILHAEFPDAAKVAQKTVEAHLRKLRDQGDVADAPRPGRPAALNATQLDAAVRHFEGGYYVEPDTPAGKQQWFGFTSPVHAVLHSCPNSEKLRQIWQWSGLTLRGFWDALKRHKGVLGFNKIRIEYHKSLDNDVKQERVREAKKWEKWSKDELERTVFLDESAVWLSGAQTLECYAPDGWTDQQREGLLDIRDSFKIKFLSGVNARLGGVFMEQISGSMALETPWMVRT
jgi:hypothetical protein